MSPYLLLALAYLVGATPTSLWVGRVFHGVDLRQKGSGNLGATNTFRTLGWKAALPVVLVDVAKGFLPVALFVALDSASTRSEWALAYGGAAILGHVFSFWVGFRGGKGVATSAGAFLALAPWAVLAAFVVWTVVVMITRIVALGSLVAAVVLPVAVWVVPPPGGTPVLIFAAGLAAFVVWAHRSNIGRLLRGEENRFSSSDGASRASSSEESEAP